MRTMLWSLLLLACNMAVAANTAPLVIGDTFTIASTVLEESRRVNVFVPTYYGDKIDAALPVLYMPDGGIHEDFMHVAGLLDVSVVNGTMRPFILVGIENTARRRDLTPPSEDPRDREIAPVIGGSNMFRDFFRNELMPEIARRYRVTDEQAIIGESLAGLFIVETFFEEPTLFDSYVAIDPSLWWNNEKLLGQVEQHLVEREYSGRRLYLASSSEPTIIAPVAKLAALLRRQPEDGLEWHFSPLAEELHHTVYHPAALRAFRELFPRK